MASGRLVAVVYLLLVLRRVTCGSKVYNGQRMYTDARIISFIDPAKHGFHVILDDDFVKSHLQPVHLPTVYASAIALRPLRSRAIGPVLHRAHLNDSAVPVAQVREGALRVTKVLYPENGNPEDGLLDGRTIKLLGLQERTWYYVCVEFESNVNRHEIATGTSCRLARTLDKFGKTIESTISEIELIEITDQSIRVQVTVDTDFPVRLQVYLGAASGEMTSDESRFRPGIATPSAQTFVLKRTQTLSIKFGPGLQPETSYGRICIYEEPLSDAYTAMGRSAKVTFEHCYFDDLKTKARDSDSVQKIYENGVVLMTEQARTHGQREMARLVSSTTSGSSTHLSSLWALVLGCTLVSLLCFIS